MRFMRESRRRRLFLLAALTAAVIAIGVSVFFGQSRESGVPPPLRFTAVSYAQEQSGTSVPKIDLSKCIITLAYVEFIVDGNYHTPKVTITCQGRRLKKNVDYKLTFSGGRDAGKSTVRITGIGNCKGVVTKTYTGIPEATKATTAKSTKAAKTTRTTEATRTTRATTVTNAAKPAKATKASKPTKAAKATKEASSAKAAKATKPTNTTKVTVVYKTTSTAVRPKKQAIRAMSSYTFSEAGRSKKIGAKVSSGLKLKYKSSNTKVVAVDRNGVMRAKKAGTAKITIQQKGNGSFKPVSRSLRVKVPSLGSREEALRPWRHVLIDTFFHINDRKYSHGNPGKFWKNSHGKWSGRTGKKGNTQSCVTLSTVSLKRIGLLSAGSGCVWLSSNHGTKPNNTVKRLRKSSKTLAISYPHKSLKYLAEHNMIRYGDILCRSGHTFVYMGKDSGGHPLIYESGTRRDIGNGTCVIWGHHSGGYADKLTGKINRQIQQSNARGEKWRKGKLSDNAFRGHRAKGRNLNKPVHIVCSIRTFKVRTSCINGRISSGKTYMAGESATVRFKSSSGKPAVYVKVDGRKVKAKSKYTFRRITADHTVEVKYK